MGMHLFPEMYSTSSGALLSSDFLGQFLATECSSTVDDHPSETKNLGERQYDF